MHRRPQPELLIRSFVRVRTALVGALLGAALLVAPGIARASTFSVTTTADGSGTGTCAAGGPCALRQAINAAATGDTVSVPPGTYQLTLGALSVSRSITIAGAGASTTTITEHGQADRVLGIVGTNLSVTISGVTIADGSSPDGHGGAGIYQPGAGTLTLDNTVLTGNVDSVTGGAINAAGNVVLADVTVSHNSGFQGGGVYLNGGSLTVTKSLFANNTAPTGGGGGIYASGGTVRLTNTTFSQNGASSAVGGGIDNAGGTLSLTNVTFGDESATGNPGGDDLYNAGAATVANTIFGPKNFGVSCAGTAPGSGGGNLDAGTSCGFGSGDQSSTDAQLLPIAENGGATQTFSIAPSSTAIGFGVAASCPSTDQRGEPRPAGACDSGAFQRQQTDPAPPFARTDPVSGVTGTSATLGATVNPGGLATTYHFEWATPDLSSGTVSSTPDVSLAASASNSTVNTRIGQLAPGTFYQYRVVATNADGTTDGTPVNFETPVDQGPVCGPASATVSSGSTVTVSLPCADTDGDTITRSIVGNPTRGGSLGQVDQLAGAVTYTAPAGFVGVDLFSFKATDSQGISSRVAVATVTVTGSSASGGSGGSGSSGGSTGSGGGGGGGGTGGSGSPAGGFSGPAPACDTVATVGFFSATGCFTTELGRFLGQPDTRYVFTGPMRLNGLTIVPKYTATKVTLDTGLGLVRSSSDVTVLAGAIRVLEGPLLLEEGDVTGKADALAGVLVPPLGSTVGGLPLDGPLAVHVTRAQGTELVSVVNLGAILPPPIPKVDAGADFKTTLAGGLQSDSLAVSVDDVFLGPVELKHVVLAYSEVDDLWQGAATLVLPTPNALAISGSLAIQHGQFKSVAAQVDNLNTDLGSGVFLQRVQVSVAVNPLMLGGGLGITLGPQVQGKAAVRIDGNFAYTFSDPGLLHVEGLLQLAGIPVASAFVNYRTSGEIDFGGQLQLGLPNPSAKDPTDQPVYIQGAINGFVDGTAAFDVEAGVKVNLKPLGVVGLQADLLASNVGIAGCGRIAFITGGFGYTWATGQLTLMGPWLCDVGPWRSANPAAAADASAASARRTLVLPGGGSLVKLTGAGGAPKAILTGPGGQQVRVPTGSTSPVINDRFVVLQDPSDDVTYIGIHNSAGRWTISPEPDSAPFARIQDAALLPAPSVHAHVSGLGRTRVLTWHVGAEPRQRVVFYEKGSGGMRELASTATTNGRVRFTPADGPGGRRTIVAEVLSDGRPRVQLTVASYEAPTPIRPGRPRGIRVRPAASGGVAISWTAAADAQAYLVQLVSAHGVVAERLVPATARHLTLSPPVPIQVGTVTVIGRRTDGLSGPGANATYRAARVGRSPYALTPRSSPGVTTREG
jgi:hypothetical protein